MKKIFVDTNVIVDLIADRKPFSKFAIDLFSKAEQKTVKLYTSSHSIATTHYLLRKYSGDKQLREILLELLEIISVIPVDENIMRKSLRSKYKDFEDGIQVMCASTVDRIDCIVTRNTRDFKGSEISVLAPEEVFRRLKSN